MALQLDVQVGALISTVTEMKKTVLIVDDNKAMRYLLATTLGRRYNVVDAQDAHSAMQLLFRNRIPDLIIANSSLPDAPDWEMIDYLTSSGFYRHVALIVLSDDTQENTLARCRAMAVEHFFRKPFSPEKLAHTAAALLGTEMSESKRFFRFMT